MKSFFSAYDLPYSCYNMMDFETWLSTDFEDYEIERLVEENKRIDEYNKQLALQKQTQKQNIYHYPVINEAFLENGLTIDSVQYIEKHDIPNCISIKEALEPFVDEFVDDVHSLNASLKDEAMFRSDFMRLFYLYSRV
jgi:hypothetical protein